MVPPAQKRKLSSNWIILKIETFSDKSFPINGFLDSPPSPNQACQAPLCHSKTLNEFITYHSRSDVCTVTLLKPPKAYKTRPQKTLSKRKREREIFWGLHCTIAEHDDGHESEFRVGGRGAICWKVSHFASGTFWVKWLQEGLLHRLPPHCGCLPRTANPQLLRSFNKLNLHPRNLGIKGG